MYKQVTPNNDTVPQLNKNCQFDLSAFIMLNVRLHRIGGGITTYFMYLKILNNIT
jgi:hypothetical protein